jgi:hypothetical protein
LCIGQENPVNTSRLKGTSCTKHELQTKASNKQGQLRIRQINVEVAGKQCGPGTTASEHFEKGMPLFRTGLLSTWPSVPTDASKNWAGGPNHLHNDTLRIIADKSVLHNGGQRLPHGDKNTSVSLAPRRHR